MTGFFGGFLSSAQGCLSLLYLRIYTPKKDKPVMLATLYSAINTLLTFCVLTIIQNAVKWLIVSVSICAMSA